MGLQPRDETTTAWWSAGTMMVIITTATVVGNGAVMLALLRVRRAPSHYPLLSLVTADLLVGILVQPLAAMRELYVFKLNRFICSCWSTMDVLCCTASILSLCVLGWERWSAITSPLTRARRARRAKVLSGLVWPVAASIALPDALIPSPRHFHLGELEKACVVNTNIDYVFFSVSLSFYLPATIMMVLYGFILRALSSPPQLRAHRGRDTYLSQRNTTAINSVFNSGQGDADTNQNTVANFITRQRRATRIIVMLMILFLVCWTPYFIILPLDALYDCVYEATWSWCSWLGYVNSSLNPLVYAAASPAVREALRSSFSSGRNTELHLTPRRK